VKQISADTEIKLIFALCNGDLSVKTSILSTITVEHFGYSPTREVFERVLVLLKAGKNIPATSTLKEDTALSEKSQELLGAKKTVVGKNELQDLLDTAESYRKVRLLFSCANNIVENLKGKEKVDIESVIQESMDTLANAKTGSKFDNLVLGDKDNSEEAFDRILNGKVHVIPTGMKVYDSINGGYFKGFYVTIASNSGGGKSTLALQQAVYMMSQGFKVAYVGLEMGSDEYLERICSYLCRINYDHIRLKKLTERQKRHILKVKENFSTLGKTEKSNLTIVKPQDFTTFTSVMYSLAPKGFDVIFIDYPALLKQEDVNMPQWQALQQMSAQGKMFADKYNCVIVGLAQLDMDKERVKYSTAIIDNSSLVIQWNYGKEQKENKVVTMEMTKARNQVALTWDMKTEFEYCSFADLDSEDETLEDNSDKVKEAKSKYREQKKSNKPKANYNEDDLLDSD